MTISRIMNAGQLLGLSLGLAIAAGTTLPASAADWNNGDGAARKSRGSAAVPVPAPEPVPDYASGYYVRVDGVFSHSDTKNFRSSYPMVDDNRINSGLDNYGRLGFGAGYYFSRWLRADVTFDIRGEVRGKAGGSTTYSVSDPGYDPLGSAVFRDTYDDRIRYKNYTAMANLYADIPMGHSFTPYVGVGLGVAIHRSTRQFTNSTDCIVDLVATDCDPVAAGQQGSTNIRSTSIAANDSAYGLAAAAMVGFTYQFSRIGKIDAGYRWLFIDGVDFNHGGEVLSVPDQNIHELRVGLRYDIN